MRTALLAFGLLALLSFGAAGGANLRGATEPTRLEPSIDLVERSTDLAARPGRKAKAQKRARTQVKAVKRRAHYVTETEGGWGAVRRQVVAFLRTGAFARWRGDKARRVSCGEQAETLEGARVFVVPNPSGRNAHFTYAQMKAIYRRVARAVAPRP